MSSLGSVSKSPPRRLLIAGCIVASVGVGGVFVVAGARERWSPHALAGAAPASTGVELATDYRHALRLPADFLTNQRFRTSKVLPAPPPAPLTLQGSVTFDPNRLA